MAGQWFASTWRQMMKKKYIANNMLETQLSRCLTTWDLTIMGIGQMAGAGIYVLTGTVIRDKAGPAVFLCFVIAGITAFFNAICYAELSSRFPKAGSAYTYTYVAGGEFFAFIIGWSMILEYVLSAASVARGLSGTIDVLAHGAISNGSMTYFPFPESPFLAPYPDFLSFGIIIIFCLLLLSGPKMSARFTMAITIVNIGVLVFIIITMFAKADPYTYAEKSHGGFLPYSFLGVLAGTGTCFYAYIGFDALAVCVEEAKNPKKSMPRALGVSVTVVSVLFVLSSLALPMFVPWYTINRESGFTAAFQDRGMIWASYIVGIGSLFGIVASLFTSLFTMPRVAYAMADDGLIFRFFAQILPSTKVPIWSILIFGFITAILALILDIKALADFLSIGTLISFTIVNINVLLLRYRDFSAQSASIDGSMDSNFELGNQPSPGSLRQMFRTIPVLRNCRPGVAAQLAILVFVVVGIAAVVLTLIGEKFVAAAAWWAILLLCIFVLILCVCLFVINIHEEDFSFDSFRVPAVPYIPCLCIILNLCLIVKLSALTWARYFGWLIIGFFIYFCYGVRHSSLNGGAEEVTPLVNAQSQEINLMSSGEMDNIQSSYKSTDIRRDSKPHEKST